MIAPGEHFGGGQEKMGTREAAHSDSLLWDHRPISYSPGTTEWTSMAMTASGKVSSLGKRAMEFEETGKRKTRAYLLHA